MLFLLFLLSSIAQLAMFPLHSFSSIGLFTVVPEWPRLLVPVSMG